jgi:lysine-N-methylase
MKLRVLPELRFTCSACGQCCYGWHCQLMPGEVEKVNKLVWPTGDPMQEVQFVLNHAGKQFLAKAADTGCVFLNRSNGLCRIHEQFGADAKPLGCRVYPYQIVPTFAGEVTVTGRYDCPTIRANAGTRYSDSLDEITQYAKRMDLPSGFNEAACRPFKKDQIEAIGEFADTLMAGFGRGDQRALFILFLCEWLQQLDPAQVDRMTLASGFGELKKRVESASAEPPRRPGLLARLAFRTLLGLYLRRDEDMLNRKAGRGRRLLSMVAIVFGFGSFAGLGLVHPKGQMRRARLFRSGITPPDLAVFDLHWRMVHAKLGSLQFMGLANRGRDFLTGLRTLALLYPLVLAAAKYRAANRDGGATVDASDVDYAVSVIEHSYGRSALLAQRFARSLERFLLDRNVLVQLVRSV